MCPTATIKPPLGLTPKTIWEGQCQRQRLDDIKAAIARYAEVDKPIPAEWMHEYNGLAIMYCPAEVLSAPAQAAPLENDHRRRWHHAALAALELPSFNLEVECRYRSNQGLSFIGPGRYREGGWDLSGIEAGYKPEAWRFKE